MESIPISPSTYLVTTVTLALVFAGLVAWVFRGSASEKYEEYGKIPLKDHERPRGR